MTEPSTRKQRPNGSGSICQQTRPNGNTCWVAYWSYKDRITGKARRSSKRFTKQADAAKHLRQVTRSIDEGSWVKPTKTTVAVYMDKWLKDLRRSPQTVAGWRIKVRLHISPHIGHIPLSEVQPSHLDDLYRMLERDGSPGGNGPLSRSTVREVHNILSSAFSAAARSGELGQSEPPTRRANPPTLKEAKAKRAEIRTWTGEELKGFLADMLEQGDHYYPLWHLMAMTGLRRGEALALRWRDIDLELGGLVASGSLGEVRLEDADGRRSRSLERGPTKNGKSRPIGLDQATVAVLRQHKRQQNEDRLRLGSRWEDQGLVFCRGSLWLGKDDVAGGPFDPERISQAFQRRVSRLAKAGLTVIRLHDLRHTWATLAMAQGVAVKVVSERLGHHSAAYTADTYQHVMAGMDQEAAEAVASLLA
jgi:integrase